MLNVEEITVACTFRSMRLKKKQNVALLSRLHHFGDNRNPCYIDQDKPVTGSTNYDRVLTSYATLALANVP